MSRVSRMRVSTRVALRVALTPHDIKVTPQPVDMVSSWCHDGVMDLAPYVDDLQRQLSVAAEAGGDEARVVAERLSAQLEAATRLVLLDALSTAAGEITRELAPGSVDLRLRGRDLEFVVA